MAKNNWLTQFVRWLKAALHFAPHAKATITIREEFHADGISVLRLEDTSIPGLADLWRIDRHHDRVQFFICIINLAMLRQDLAMLGTTLEAITRSKGLAHVLRQQIKDQAHVLGSHYWITGWNLETSGTDKHGRFYRSHRTTDLQLVVCDLQGISAAFAGDRYAKRFARKVIKQLAACEFREYSSSSKSWRSCVMSIDWIKWLSGMACKDIDLYHQLQPKKLRLK